MKILAIETSTMSGSVAILSGNEVLREAILPDRPRTASTLVPAIRRLLNETGCRLGDVELIAVTTGPGSFTGLRVGITTAKTVAYATGCELLGLDTLEVLAAQSGATTGQASTVLDAQRDELFAASFEMRGGKIERVAPTRIVSSSDWVAGLSPDTVVSGLGLRRVRDQLPAAVLLADESRWTPRAAAAGRLALRDWQAGRRDDLWKLAPTYLRKSAAEEKLDAKSGD